MKGMPLPFDFDGKGVLELVAADYTLLLSSSDPYFQKWDCEGRVLEPTSVLDNITSPNPPTSTLTLSSSLGGGGGCGSTDTKVAAVSSNPSSKWPPVAGHHEATSSINVAGELGCVISDLQPVPPSLEIGGGGHDNANTRAAENCGLGMEGWEGVLSDSVATSPSQEQSILRWIMGDVEDPSLGLNKVLQIGGGSAADFNFNGTFGVVD